MSAASDYVASAAAVLLDFDGPVTPLLPAPLNAQAAEAARRPLIAAGVSLPASVALTTDHLAVLRYAGTLDADALLAEVEEASISAEVDAAAVSRPAEGGHEFMRAIAATGRPLVLVTNNAPEAVVTYLARFGLADSVTGIAAREPHRPERMKPDPAPIVRALALAQVQPAYAVMVGDSVGDVEAANLAGVRCIGLAKDTTRAEELQHAGAVALVRSMTLLDGRSHDAARRGPLPN